METVLFSHSIANLSNHAILAGANLLLHSTLLIAAGLFAARLCRNQGAALQSLILRATLVALITAPAITCLLEVVGVKGKGFSVIKAAALPEVATTMGELVSEPTEVPQIAYDPTGSRSTQTDRAAVHSPQRAATRGVVSQGSTGRAEFLQPPRRRNGLTLLYVAFTAVWTLVSLGLLARLAICHWRIRRLRWQAGMADVVIYERIRDLPSKVPYSFEGHAQSPDWSRDGRLLACAVAPQGSGRAEGSTVICIRDLLNGTEKELKLDGGSVWAPRWSPTGSFFIAAGVEKQRYAFFQVDGQSGKTVWLPIRPGASQLTGWSPDGQAFYYQTSQAIVRHEIRSKTEIQFPLSTNALGITYAEHAPASLSPDAKRIAFRWSNSTNSQSICVAELSGGEPRRLVEFPAQYWIKPYDIIWTPDSHSIVFMKELWEGSKWKSETNSNLKAEEIQNKPGLRARFELFSFRILGLLRISRFGFWLRLCCSGPSAVNSQLSRTSVLAWASSQVECPAPSLPS